MIGTGRRKIAEEKVRNATCQHCNESNTLVATVYSKFFMLKILPFVTGKSAEVNCTACKKDFRDERLDLSVQNKVNEIKGDTNHPWYLYIGYGLLALGFIIGILNDKQ